MSVTTVNPATGAKLAEYQAHTDAQLNAILDAATAAQAQWRHSSVETRVAALRALGQILRDEVDHHASLISNEMGKPISEARGEVLKCATTCDYYAGFTGKLRCYEGSVRNRYPANLDRWNGRHIRVAGPPQSLVIGVNFT